MYSRAPIFRFLNTSGPVADPGFVKGGGPWRRKRGSGGGAEPQRCPGVEPLMWGQGVGFAP